MSYRVMANWNGKTKTDGVLLGKAHQVGVYRTKDAAREKVADLKRKGYKLVRAVKI